MKKNDKIKDMLNNDLLNLEPRKVGRPTVITDKVVKKLESIFKLNVNDRLACRYAKISHEAYYQRCKKDLEFADRMDAAKGYARIAAGRVVLNAIIKDKNLQAAQWWLERKHPDEFGHKPQVEVNVDNRRMYVVLPAERSRASSS